VTRQLRVDLLDTDGTTLVPSLKVAGGGTAQVQMSTAGRGRLTVASGVAGYAQVRPGKLLRLHLDGTPVHTGRIVTGDERLKAADPSKCGLTVTFADWLAEFDQAPISPPAGVNSLPTATVLRSDWTHPWVDTSTWPRPVFLGSVFRGDVDQFGNLASWATPTAMNGAHPDGYLDSFAGWIGGVAANGAGSHSASEVWYFDLRPTLAAGPLVGIMTGASTAAWALDGILYERGVDAPAEQRKTAYALGEDEVTAGTHVFRAKVAHRAAADPNPALFAATFYQQVTDASLTWPNVVARTGLNVDSPDPKMGGGWRVLRTPASPPGLTWGRFYRAMFDAAHAEGYLQPWTLDFSDTVDSAGNAWPVRDDMTARVNDRHGGFLQASRDMGWAETGAHPTQRKLRAWVHGRRGSYWGFSGTPTMWGDGNLSEVNRSLRETPNTCRVQWARGRVTEVTTAAPGVEKRVETLAANDCETLAAAQAAGQAYLASKTAGASITVDGDNIDDWPDLGDGRTVSGIVDGAGAPTLERVMEIQLDWDANGATSITPTLRSPQEEAAERDRILADRLATGMTGGRSAGASPLRESASGVPSGQLHLPKLPEWSVSGIESIRCPKWTAEESVVLSKVEFHLTRSTPVTDPEETTGGGSEDAPLGYPLVVHIVVDNTVVTYFTIPANKARWSGLGGLYLRQGSVIFPVLVKAADKPAAEDRTLTVQFYGGAASLRIAAP